MIIKNFDVEFSRQPFVSPFGFKGSYLSEMWRTSVSVTDDSGVTATGIGAQSVLWSDPALFTQHPEAVSNAMMLQCTALATRQATGIDWNAPPELLDAILENVHQKAGCLTGRENELRLTFTLNAMVALDNAAWLLTSRHLDRPDFEAMIPPELQVGLAEKQERIAAIPLISYGVGSAAIEQLLDDGHCLLKIKIGSDPQKNGDPADMVAWDKQRLADIHSLAKDRRTPHTESGQVLYYLDVNGRYDTLEHVEELLEFAERIGALERIILLEEPFPEDVKINVSQLPVRVAADESAHSVADVKERIDLGYGAIALKPIAKTLSMTLRMLAEARAHNIPCFCADLTVPPLLVEWNKNLAARLSPLPGMKIGAMETNGAQNYRDWSAMLARLPFPNASWVTAHQGVFTLNEEFYAQSGGIFDAGKIRCGKGVLLASS